MVLSGKESERESFRVRVIILDDKLRGWWEEKIEGMEYQKKSDEM